MEKSSNYLKQVKGHYHPTDDDYIGNTVMEYYVAKSKFTLLHKIIILTVISSDFVKASATEFADQLDQFSNSLNGLTGPTALATKYGYTTGELLSIKRDAAYWRFWFTKHGAGATYAKAWTDKGEEARHGTGPSSSGWPVGADISGAPIDVLPGIEKRFRAMAKKAKDQTIYTPGDGNNMAIEVVHVEFVPGAGKPDLKIKLTGGGHPKIKYIQSKYVGIRVYKNSNDGHGWVFLCVCNDPEFTDMSALPAVGTSAVWSYKAFYLFGGEEVGTISKDTTITVMGLVVPSV